MGEGRARNGEKSNSSIFLLLCILVFIVGVVAAAGMVMAILTYTNEANTPVSISVDGARPGSSYRVDVGGSSDGVAGAGLTSYNQGKNKMD